MIRLKKDIKGFTMMETAVTIIIFLILVLFLPKLFSQLNTSMLKASANISAQQGARVATQNVVRFLSVARHSTITISSQPGEPPYSMIAFQSSSGDAISIFQRGSNLIHSKNGAEGTLLKGGLQRLAFTYPDLTEPNYILVTVTSVNSLRGQAKPVMETAMKKVHLENQ